VSLREIETVGLVHLVDKRLMLVRPVGKHAFYLPGGKRERGETDLQALRREVAEELGLELLVETCRPAGSVTAAAYGESVGSSVVITCYTGALLGVPEPKGEIAEVRYFDWADYSMQQERAPAVVALMLRLMAHDLLL
jgi:8-oxo-dGTP diphosphatase